MSGPGALSISVSGRGGFCVGPRLCLSGPGAICVEPRRSLPLCVGARHSLCWGLRSLPLCVGPRRSLCDALAVSGALCVRARRSLCRGPASLCRGPALSPFLCRGLAVSVSGPVALCVSSQRFLCQDPGYLCRGLALGFFVGAWRSLCQGPALFVPLSLCRAPALSVRTRCSLCRGPVLSLCDVLGLPGALFFFFRQIFLLKYFLLQRLRSVSGPCAPRRSLCQALCPTNVREPPGHPPAFSSDPRATYPFRGPPTQDSRATHPVRGPQLRSACHPSSPARSFFSGENPKPYCLGDKIKCKKHLVCFL